MIHTHCRMARLITTILIMLRSSLSGEPRQSTHIYMYEHTQYFDQTAILLSMVVGVTNRCYCRILLLLELKGLHRLESIDPKKAQHMPCKDSEVILYVRVPSPVCSVPLMVHSSGQVSLNQSRYSRVLFGVWGAFAKSALLVRTGLRTPVSSVRTPRCVRAQDSGLINSIHDRTQIA